MLNALSIVKLLLTEKKDILIEVNKMKKINIIEASVIGLFTFLFAGYALFVYPFEKLRALTDPAVQRRQVKYASKVS